MRCKTSACTPGAKASSGAGGFASSSSPREPSRLTKHSRWLASCMCIMVPFHSLQSKQAPECEKEMRAPTHRSCAISNDKGSKDLSIAYR